MKASSFTSAVALSLAALLSSANAEAAKLSNLDDKPYVLVVFEGDSQREVEIGPLSEIDDLCAQGCEVQFGEDPQPYEVAGNGVFVIENGALYDDTPDAGSDDAGAADPQGEYETLPPDDMGGGEPLPQDLNAN